MSIKDNYGMLILIKMLIKKVHSKNGNILS